MIFSKLTRLILINGKLQLALFILLIFLQAMMDLLSVISIFPFMALLGDVDSLSGVGKLFWITDVVDKFNFENKKIFLLFASFLVILMANMVKLGVVKFQLSFCARINQKLNWRLVSKYISMPYDWHLQKNSSEIGKNLLTEIDQVVYGGIFSLSVMFSSTISAAAILIFLAYMDLGVALSIMAFFGVAYGLSIYLTRLPLRRIGEARFAANEKRFQVLNDTFVGIKEVKLSRNAAWFLSQYSPALWTYIKYHALANFIKQIPRYVLEVIAIGAMMLVILYFIGQGRPFTEVVPIISVYAYAGYKLLPYFHAIYGANAGIQFSQASIDTVYNDVTLEKRLHQRFQPSYWRGKTGVMRFDNKVRIENLTFSYEGASKPSLSNVNLTLRKGTSVGVVGVTGSGKSTFIDCVVGLLRVKEGMVTVDDICVTLDNCEEWQQNIGYVSQSVFVFDDTIKNNIVFGVSDKEVDSHLLEKIIRLVRLENVVDSLVNDNAEATIGDRGVRLSGGQLQRIGIARALYKCSDLLVLDEATSALDAITESKLIAGIKKEFPQLTVLLVTHNTDLVKDCDEVIVLDEGVVTARGNYEKLLNDSPIFQSLARHRIL